MISPAHSPPQGDDRDLPPLHAATPVTVEVDALLIGTAFQGKDCPWIRYWFDLYATKPADNVERALKKFGGADTAGVTTAVGYMQPVVARIATSVTHWRTTGEVTGIPDGVDPDHPSEPGDDRDDIPVLSRAKAADGATADLAGGSTMLAAAGPGRAIDSDVGVQLASAVGAGSGVRIHTDEPRVSALGARAVTLGSHIAFAPGVAEPGRGCHPRPSPSSGASAGGAARWSWTRWWMNTYPPVPLRYINRAATIVSSHRT